MSDEGSFRRVTATRSRRVMEGVEAGMGIRSSMSSVSRQMESLAGKAEVPGTIGCRCRTSLNRQHHLHAAAESHVEDVGGGERRTTSPGNSLPAYWLMGLS